MEKLYTVEEAAGALRLSKWTIAKWLSEGKLPRTKIGSRTVIRESDLQAFVARCNAPAVEEATPCAK